MGWGYDRFDGFDYPQYVSIAEKQEKAQKMVKSLEKKLKRPLQPVQAEGRMIAQTFWGNAWCSHIESFQDEFNRLERGRSYVKNGFVLDLAISQGRIDAYVSGSGKSPYKIVIDIDPLPKERWEAIRKRATGKINSLLSLIQGELPTEVIESFSNPETGLFPTSREFHKKCSCPDWSGLCKHLAAVLYAVGVRLDTEPELLFLLRGVDQNDLISDNLDALTDTGQAEIPVDNLSDIF